MDFAGPASARDLPEDDGKAAEAALPDELLRPQHLRTARGRTPGEAPDIIWHWLDPDEEEDLRRFLRGGLAAK